MQPTAPTNRPSRFPLIFELLMWGLYVGLYKYAVYTNEMPAFAGPRTNFPYPHLCGFALLATAYVVPYYRWLVPRLLQHRQYILLLVGTLAYFWLGSAGGFWLTHWLFERLAALGLPRLTALPRWWNLELTVTDLIAFSCVAFAQFAFANEQRRRLLERDHLALQLAQLKSQLQPHFLFNTLNSIYGLSLAGSPETPRFILLLSELMRYVLYDSGREYVALPEEITFLENYFEMEQRKYAGARITFTATGAADAAGLQVPPLLLLPLVENSFKHGRHHFSDKASVEATLTTAPGHLHFVVENDLLPEMPVAAPGGKRSGGIGLVNIRQRLQLYYPNAHELVLSETAGRYRAELTLHMP